MDIKEAYTLVDQATTELQEKVKISEQNHKQLQGRLVQLVHTKMFLAELMEAKDNAKADKATNTTSEVEDTKVVDIAVEKDTE